MTSIEHLVTSRKPSLPTQDLDEAQKLNFAVDVESIKDQLAKPEPNRGVIGHLWDALENLTTIEGLAAAVTRVHELLSPLLA